MVGWLDPDAEITPEAPEPPCSSDPARFSEPAVSPPDCSFLSLLGLSLDPTAEF